MAKDTHSNNLQQWITNDLRPDAFLTINLASVPPVIEHHPAWYLNRWTRLAESELLGSRTLKIADHDRRILWLFIKEVAPDGMRHYHGVARFPRKRIWRGEGDMEGTLDARCTRMENALQAACQRTPGVLRAPHRDIHVIPFDGVERNHARYLLKQMARDAVVLPKTDACDSGLLILPNLPRPRLNSTLKSANDERVTLLA